MLQNQAVKDLAARLKSCPFKTIGSNPNAIAQPVAQSRWIPAPICDTLSTCRQGEDFLRKTGAHFYA
jgi:hypothetical protein